MDTRPVIATLALLAGIAFFAQPSASAFPDQQTQKSVIHSKTLKFTQQEGESGGLIVETSCGRNRRQSVIDLSALPSNSIVDVRGSDVGSKGTFSLVVNKNSPWLITVASKLTTSERKAYQQGNLTDIVVSTKDGKVFYFNVVCKENPRAVRYSLLPSQPILALLDAPKPLNESQKPQYLNRATELIDLTIKAEAQRLKSTQVRELAEKKAVEATKQVNDLKAKISTAAQALSIPGSSAEVGAKVQSIIDQQEAEAKQARENALIAVAEEEYWRIKVAKLRAERKILAAEQSALWSQWAEVAKAGNDPGNFGYVPSISPPEGFEQSLVQLIAQSYAKFHGSPASEP